METTDLPRLKSTQKRAMFKARFDALLKDRGFEYRRGRFMRFHRSEVLLAVSLELSRTGTAEIRFGAMPLCIPNFNPGLRLGEGAAEFGKLYNLSGDLQKLPFEEQLDLQAGLFERHLLEPFAEIDSIALLLDYQERILEDRISVMPADWAAWECVHLRDYEKACRYAQLWEKLEEDAAEAYNRQGKAAIMQLDLSERDRRTHLRDFDYRCKCRMHQVYEARRLAHLLELGAYPLLHENIRRNIIAANAAFDKID